MQAKNANPLQAARFLRAVASLGQLPPDQGVEVAVAGRSNAGKSSTLNRLCEQGKLARTSKTPGRTQQLVYFILDEARHLVDLPGYGFADVPLAVRAQWGELIENYFARRQCLRGLLVVMDARHPLKPYDESMLQFAEGRGLPVLVLLNKADKLARGEQAKTLAAVRRELPERIEVQLFSASSGQGADTARRRLCDWLGTGVATA